MKSFKNFGRQWQFDRSKGKLALLPPKKIRATYPGPAPIIVNKTVFTNQRKLVYLHR